MPKDTSKPTRARRNREALERASDRVKRGDEAQIKALDSRLGEGVGAKRERGRLA